MTFPPDIGVKAPTIAEVVIQIDALNKANARLDRMILKNDNELQRLKQLISILQTEPLPLFNKSNEHNSANI